MYLRYDGVIVAKKNNKRIMRAPNGRPWIASSQEAKAQEQLMAYEFAKQAKAQDWQADDKKAYRVAIGIVEPDKRRRDLDNQATAILDALVLAGVLPDDDNKHLNDLHIFTIGYNKADPHARVIISETEATETWNVPTAQMQIIRMKNN